MKLHFSSYQFTRTLFLLSLIFILFNVNFEVTAAPGPIVGEGLKGFISKWITIANTAPNAPGITGPTSGIVSTNYTYNVNATDSQGDQIRYGIDWNIDGTADEWLPAGVAYVPSGASQSTSHSWSSAGTKTFQALAQDASGLNSAWTPYTVAISAPSTYSVTVNPPTGGSVKSSDNNINCTPTCSSSYSAGTNVTLQATPASSYWKFTGWSGDCSGVGYCVLNVNSAKVVSASFAPRQFQYIEF